MTLLANKECPVSEKTGEMKPVPDRANKITVEDVSILFGEVRALNHVSFRSSRMKF